MDTPTAQLISTLQSATQDLLWMSEIDAAFTVVHWQKQVSADLSEAEVLQLTDHSPTTPVSVVELEIFFSAATQEQAWFGEEEKAIAQQYRALVILLQQSLMNLKVYRIGETTLDLYILGQTKTDGLVGLMTQAVET